MYRGARSEIRTRQLLVELDLKTQQLARLSYVDAMTDLRNRRSFEATYDDWSEDPEIRSLSLLLFDIDKFKQFNDSHGHPAGDECIRSVAKAVVEVLRSDSLAFRMGGEEFAILSKCSLEDAKVIAHRILSSVRTQCPVTISVGICTQAGQARLLAELYSAADRALYRAKANGRNRFDVAERDGSPTDL